MSWVRATITSFVLVVVAVIFLAYIPNKLLTKIHIWRGGQVAVCTAFFTLAVAGILFGLRRLQGRRVI